MKRIVTALLATALMLLPMTALAAEDTADAPARSDITVVPLELKGDKNEWYHSYLYDNDGDESDECWNYRITEPVDYSKVVKGKVDFSFHLEWTSDAPDPKVGILMTKAGLSDDEISQLGPDDYYTFSGSLKHFGESGNTMQLDLSNVPSGDYTIWLVIFDEANDENTTYTTVDITLIDKADAQKNGWYKANNKWYYGKNGKVSTGFTKIKGKWYFFNAEGVMQKGWQISAGKWYYMESSGKMAPSGWKKLSGKWYYLDKGSDMVVGFKKIKGSWYLFGEDGKMTTGWQSYGDRYYYMEKSGKMAIGWKKIGNKWYYLDKGGDMVEGWKKIGGKWYFFMSEKGYMLANVQANIDGKWYIFNSSGVMK